MKKIRAKLAYRLVVWAFRLHPELPGDLFDMAMRSATERFENLHRRRS